MEVILLENIRKLGKFGSKVQVAKGFGRNYLIPQGKAVPATKDNLSRFEAQRQELQASADGRLQKAQELAGEVASLHVVLKAKAGEEGKLYGSIGTYDISKAFAAHGVKIGRGEIRLPNGPLRELGDFEVELQLHAEVVVNANLSIQKED